MHDSPRSGHALSIVGALLLAATTARAEDLRVSVGTDVLFTTTARDASADSAPLANTELGISARVDLRRAAKRWDFKLDFQGREGFIGNSYRNQVIELHAAVHLLADRLKISIGRIRTPGGFWLIVDGIEIDAKYTRTFGQSAWAGLRAFSTGRRDTWTVPGQAVFLPVVGSALWLNHRIVTAQLAFSWTRDAIDFPLAGRQGARGILIERHVEDEYFLDGNIAIAAHKMLQLAAGFSLGTRYDVRFDAGLPGGPVTLGTATLGAVGVFGSIELRPHRAVRLRYDLNYERLRLLALTLPSSTTDGKTPSNADGSFQDHSWLLTYRAWRAVRLEARYRLRHRENTDLEHRMVANVRADQLWHGVGFVASVGVDLNRLPGKLHRRVIYSGGLSFVRSFLDLGVGIQFTDGIGSGLTFSSSVSATATTPRELFPYLLESNRVVYLRAFGTFWKMYAGLDVEENLESLQARVLVQIGGAL